MGAPIEADIVIAGGGTAGCVVAGRLATACPDLSVVIIEDGQDSEGIEELKRPLCGVLGVFAGSKNYRYHAAETSATAGDRDLIIPTANILGGGSAVNWVTYQNAAASDFNDWKQPGWSFEELLPSIKKSVNYQTEGDMTVHSTEGVMPVSSGGHNVKLEEHLTRAFKDVVPDLPRLDDMADFKHGHGWGRCVKWIGKDGTRSTSAQAYLRDGPHPNLTILTGKTCVRVIFEGERAVGVEICNSAASASEAKGSQVIKARKQVVLCSGALGSPAILERSGVGSAELMENLNIDVRCDLPGVGNGYQDHLLCLWGYFTSDINGLDGFFRGQKDVVEKAVKDWEADGSGLISTAIPDWLFKLRPTEEELLSMGPEATALWRAVGGSKPDKPLVTGAFCAFHSGDYSVLPPDCHCISNALWVNYPGSRGRVHISSVDPHAPLAFETGMLSHPADVKIHLWAYKVLREVFRHMPCFRGEIPHTHPDFPTGSSAIAKPHDGPVPSDARIKYTQADDEAIEARIRKTANTCWHAMSTCQMRPREQGGVVDPRLNVYGTQGLKVADLSICPLNCGTNTASVALIIGEKCAALIEEELRQNA